ncbi:MAG: 50S ribosomal protein L11 methyltransferase [Bacteroidales bacterium]|nr:50S ribosomal protein L11 methyltransferase [Bacteroidales bacterium]
MKYTEVTLHINPIDPFKDLLTYSLGEEGPYDSFVDTKDGMKAYVPTDQFDEAFLKEAVEEAGCEVTFEVAQMEDKNWNEEWEKNHKPVLVEDFCWVRAPFHPHREDVEYEIEIEPKMSFGTAHHQTTYMMLSLLRDEPIEGKRVLDMGCGTAVLAILAAKKKAAYVEGIDVDEWAYRNAVENCDRNGVPEVRCLLGDASSLLNRDDKFDLIIANINRNILLRDMSSYVQAMSDRSVILFSGFYESDIPAIRSKAEELGLTFDRNITRDNWTAVRFVRRKS